MRRLLLLAVFISVTLPAIAQRPPDVEAFLDAFFAKNVDELAKHLPSDIEKRIAELTPDQKLKLGRDLLLARNLEKEGGKLTRSDDPAVLITMVEKSGTDADRGEILLDRRICDGEQSMLLLKMRIKSERNSEKESLMVWLKYEDRSWRVTEVQPSESSHAYKLDEQTLLSAYVEWTPAGNESTAEAVLRTYNTALVTYRANYPDRGLPYSLEMLGTDPGDTPTPIHASLVYNGWATPPYEVSGYRFNYAIITDDPNRQYTITARPLQVGRTGIRSFYTDDSAVIRATSEDREATKDDDPI